MRIYTRTGDKGETGLIGSQRASKDSLRVEVYGTVDELNACLGLARTVTADQDFQEVLGRLQRELFDLGADLATPLEEKARPKTKAALPRIAAGQVKALEAAIDRFTEELEPLKRFILPGGTEGAARLHFARTVCRRAERRVVALAREEPINPEVLRYLNRLSDLLFVMARAANRREGQEEILW